MDRHYQSKVFVCVLTNGAYAVDRLLISHQIVFQYLDVDCRVVDVETGAPQLNCPILTQAYKKIYPYNNIGIIQNLQFWGKRFYPDGWVGESTPAKSLPDFEHFTYAKLSPPWPCNDPPPNHKF